VMHYEKRADRLAELHRSRLVSGKGQFRISSSTPIILPEFTSWFRQILRSGIGKLGWLVLACFLPKYFPSCRFLMILRFDAILSELRTASIIKH
jgi:hypothetical protein